jgi:hypothetical protein
MGQSYSSYKYQVKDPKTPYEWSKDDIILDEKQLDDIEEYIKEELEADARCVEYILLGNSPYNSYGHSLVFYGRNILRVKLDPSKYKSSHGVLSRGLRVKCLSKYMKIPYTIHTKPYENGYATIICHVLNVEHLNKSSVSASE